MNIKIFLLIVLLGIPIADSTACDICGCGAGNSYIGILPDFNQNIAGLRYRYNSVRTHVGADGENTYLTTDERYQIAEIWGGVTLVKRFRIMGILPYSFNTKTQQSNRIEKNGLGDASLWTYYQVLNQSLPLFKSKLMMQSLWIGAGTKLPSGHYTNSDASSVNDANLFQLGTGSFDFMIGGTYDLRLQDAGISVNANYKMNTPNTYSYRYGNKLSGSAQLYYKFSINGRFTLSPNAGLIFENSVSDTREGRKVLTSSGDILLAGFGFEGVISRQVVLGAGFQIPVRQHLASGIVQANNRLMIHAGWMF